MTTRWYIGQQLDPIAEPIRLPQDAVVSYPPDCVRDSQGDLILATTHDRVITTHAMGLIGTVYIREGTGGDWWRW